jgi:hypothetical protein
VQRIAESWLTPTNRTSCVAKEDENLQLRADETEVDLPAQLREFDVSQSIHVEKISSQ